MIDGLIVLFDGIILANLLAFALLLCADLNKPWLFLVGAMLLFSCLAFSIMTMGDISVWLGRPDDIWFFDREWRLMWKASLGVTLLAINTGIVIRRCGN